MMTMSKLENNQIRRLTRLKRMKMFAKVTNVKYKWNI